MREQVRRMWLLGLLAGAGIVLSLVFFHRQPETEEFLFLYLRETNSALLDAAPTGRIRAAFPTFSPEGPSLTLPTGVSKPGPQLQVIILHDVQAYDVLIESRLVYGSTFPLSVSLNQPVRWSEGARDAVGVLRGRVPIVNERRFVPRVLEVTEVGPNGTVTLQIDDHVVTLAPNQAWGIASGPVSGKVAAVPQGPQWEPFITGQLDNNRPLTVLTIYNHGWWPRAGLRIGN